MARVADSAIMVECLGRIRGASGNLAFPDEVVVEGFGITPLERFGSIVAEPRPTGSRR